MRALGGREAEQIPWWPSGGVREIGSWFGVCCPHTTEPINLRDWMGPRGKYEGPLVVGTGELRVDYPSEWPGLPHGSGTETWDDGAKYVGEFVYGQRDGQTSGPADGRTGSP